MVGIALVVLLAGTVIGWAAATVLTPPKDLSDATTFTFVTVERGDVGSSINLNAVAEWTLSPVGSNQASGTVTSVNIEPGQQVTAGAVLYTVNLRPVVIGQGAVPSFQGLSQGSKGADVAQLQSLLASLGFYKGSINGAFAYSTAAAVRAWQKSLGIVPDGTVHAGDVVFVPNLPTRVALDPKVIKRGASVAGGEPVVTGLPPEPSFYLPVTQAQAALIANGTVVEITGPKKEKWVGVASVHVADENSQVKVMLTGRDGASICGDACASIPVTDPSSFSSRVVTVATVSGLRVPSAALQSTANGQTVVIDKDGKSHRVAVVASARGMSIITGVSKGMKVRVPAATGE